MDDGQEKDYLAYVNGRVPSLRRLAHLLCGDPHQADDLVQETITRLYVVWSRASKAGNLDAYTHTMIVRIFLDDRRRGWWKVRLLRAAPELPAPATAAEENTVLRAALARVPPRQQAVLVLRFLYDLPVSEVAEILGCSTGTVKSQTSHGLSTMRRLLGDRALTRFSAGGTR